jgi:NAD-dependent deacetylase
MPVESINTLKSWINQASKIVFFGGAGVSTASGIPDFRGPEGLYSIPSDVPPEIILSHRFFMNHPKEFYHFIKTHMNYCDVLPNDCHKALAKLEKQGKNIIILTQNIDGLHQKAGSSRVIELHGSLQRFYCIKCKSPYTLDDIWHTDDLPRCTCGGIIKPDVVLFEEFLDQTLLSQAIKAMEECDLLIVGGTSLSVYPAANLIQYFHHGLAVLINKTLTNYDHFFDLIIQEPIDFVFKEMLLK